MPKHDITIDWLIRNYLPFFQRFGMEEQNIRDYFNTWKQDKEPAFVTDYLWFLFNHLIMEIAKQVKDEAKMYRLQADVYLEMTMFQRKHENKKGNHTMKQFFKCRLKHTDLESNLVMEVGVSSGSCCPFCDSLNDSRMSFKEALKSQPLASAKCTRKYGCNCTYTFHPMRDEDDNLIGKSK